MKSKFRKAFKKSRQLTQTDIEHLKRSGRYISPAKQKKAVLKPLYWIEGHLESMLNWLKSLAFLEILQLTGNLSILFAAIVFFTSDRNQRNAEVYQAWQVITAAYDQPGSGGRKEALEFLNSEPRRNPWFWLKWERQSLAGLAVQKAYLYQVQLPEAFLWGANLQGADLWGANLQGARLEKTNLQNAHLKKANLQNAYLWGANLQGADLQEAKLQGAEYTNKNTRQSTCSQFLLPHPCPTVFPNGFNPQAAGMVLKK